MRAIPELHYRVAGAVRGRWPGAHRSRRGTSGSEFRAHAPLIDVPDVRRLDLHDDSGRPIDFRRTHRFRHTRATSLLNAGVPLHVVQRYLGHLSPVSYTHLTLPTILLV